MNVTDKKHTLRMFTNGVHILTSCSDDGFGAATLTCVSQASFTPPLLTVAVRPTNKVFHCLAKRSVVALHVLSREQTEMEKKFFTPIAVQDRTINGEPFFEGITLAPILSNATAYLECAVRQIVDLGSDHAVGVWRMNTDFHASLSTPDRVLNIFPRFCRALPQKCFQQL